MLTKKEIIFASQCRIIVAKELNVPPDNIDMISILRCVKRGVKEQIKKDCSAVRIKVRGEKERDAIYLNEQTDEIIKMIFSESPPFNEWLSTVKEKYNLINSKN